MGAYTAAAVARFAHGRAVLPIDVNVRRVLERTRVHFSAEAAPALMDLGATVCLARVPRCATCPLAALCPSRGTTFAPVRKQGPFEGSFRQRRARALHAVAAGPHRVDELDADAVAALARDGLISVADGVAELPA